MLGAQNKPPAWITGKHRAYAMRAVAWQWAFYLIKVFQLALVLSVASVFLPRVRNTLSHEHRWIVFVSWALTLTLMSALVLALKPRQRSRRYEEAARALEVAIVQYEVDRSPRLEKLREGDRDAAQVVGEPLEKFA